MSAYDKHNAIARGCNGGFVPIHFVWKFLRCYEKCPEKSNLLPRSLPLRYRFARFVAIREIGPNEFLRRIVAPNGSILG